MSIKIHIPERTIEVNKETLMKSGYFKGILALNPEETMITVDNNVESVIKYLEDEHYDVRNDLIEALDYYDVDKREGTCSVRGCFASDPCIKHTKRLKLYLLQRNVDGEDQDYDAWDDTQLIVVANNEEEAITYSIREEIHWTDSKYNVGIKYLGEAPFGAKADVILNIIHSRYQRYMEPYYQDESEEYLSDSFISSTEAE